MLSRCESAHLLPIGREYTTKNNKTRTDNTNAERQRRYKERRRAQNPVKPVDQTNAERQRRYRERKRLNRLGILPLSLPLLYGTAEEPSMSEEDEAVVNVAPLPLELCWDPSLEMDNLDSSLVTPKNVVFENPSTDATSTAQSLPEIEPIEMIFNLSCNSLSQNVKATTVHRNRTEKTKADRTNRERQRRYRERKRQLMLESKSAMPEDPISRQSRLLRKEDNFEEIIVPLPLEICWAE